MARSSLRRWIASESQFSRRDRLRQHSRPHVERLEERLAPSAVSWTGGAGTLNWTDAGNWSTGAVPTSADDVTIGLAVSGPITVNIGAAANQSINSLTDTTASLQVTGGALAVATSS